MCIMPNWLLSNFKLKNMIFESKHTYYPILKEINCYLLKYNKIAQQKRKETYKYHILLLNFLVKFSIQPTDSCLII